MLIKGLVFVLIIILGAALWFPKPQLISYQASGQISQGVYWPGVNSSGRLLDANANFVKIDEATKNLHLCYQVEQGDSCHQYDVIETFGLVDTLIYMYEHKQI
jgi:hypothetical protein